jgi:hypothetical protein
VALSTVGGQLLDIALAAINWLGLCAIGLWMLIDETRSRESVRLRLAVFAAAAMFSIAADSLVLVAAAGSIEAEIVVYRALAAGWLGLCALSGSRALCFDLRVVLVGGRRSDSLFALGARSASLGMIWGALMYAWSAWISWLLLTGWHEVDGEQAGPLAYFLACAVFPLREEIVFRLGVQAFLSRQLGPKPKWHYAAILIAAGLFSLSHLSNIDEYGVKMIEIAPIGVALGFLFARSGLACAVSAHAMLNLLSAVFSE